MARSVRQAHKNNHDDDEEGAYIARFPSYSWV